MSPWPAEGAPYVGAAPSKIASLLPVARSRISSQLVLEPLLGVLEATIRTSPTAGIAVSTYPGVGWRHFTLPLAGSKATTLPGLSSGAGVCPPPGVESGVRERRG